MIASAYKFGMIALACLALSGCAAFGPAVRTFSDIAAAACAKHYSQAYGFSLDEAAEFFCKTNAQLRPWLVLMREGRQQQQRDMQGESLGNDPQVCDGST